MTPRSRSGTAGEPATRSLLVRYHDLTEDELSRLALEAPPAELELVLQHPRLTEQQIVHALRNKAITPRLIERIGNDRRWVRGYDVKAGLVMHPRSPRHIALRFLKFLYLAHLLKVLDDPKLTPGLRRQAEQLLRERLPQITLGERLSMAKGGGRGVVKVVRADGDADVLRALLQNPKLTTADVVSIIDAPRTPPPVLQAIAIHRRWALEYPVKLALARTPHAPAGVALGSLSSLLKRDLLAISRDEALRPVVRAGAMRVLEARQAAAAPGLLS